MIHRLPHDIWTIVGGYTPLAMSVEAFICLSRAGAIRYKNLKESRDLFDCFTSDARRANIVYSQILVELSYHCFDHDGALHCNADEWRDTVDYFLQMK